MIPALKALVIAAAALAAGCSHAPVRATPEPEPEPLIVRAFDVGYGDAVLASTGDQHVLFDVGPKDAGAALVRKLRAAGVGRIALLVLSHPHPDHTEGLEALLESGIPIDRAVHNPAVDWSEVPGFSALRARVPTSVAVSGTSPLQLGAMRLSFLHPDSPSQADPNNLSLVVLVEAKAGAALFPGDLVDLELQRALCSRVPPRLSVLKAPHHGDHVADCLAERTQLLLTSVAANPWGVPRKSTVSTFSERLRRTDVEGDVVVTVPGR